MNKNTFIYLAVLLISSLLISCDGARFDKEALALNKILVLTVRVNRSCTAERDITKYPNINFTGDVFRAALVNDFNSGSSNIKAMLLPGLRDLSFSGKIEDFSLLNRKYLHLSNNLEVNRLSPEQLGEILKLHSCDAYAVIDVDTSVWEQNILGDIRIFTADGVILWRQRLDVTSTYIIKDENSPYISEFDSLLDSIEKKTSHKSEVLIVFRELGENLADVLLASWNRFLLRNTEVDSKKTP